MPFEPEWMQVGADHCSQGTRSLQLLTGRVAVCVFYQIPDLNKCDENQHELISVETGKATDAATGNSWDFWSLDEKHFVKKRCILCINS